MNSTIPSNTTPLHTLIKNAKTVTLNQLMHSLTKTTIVANSMKTTKKCVVASTLIHLSLQTCAVHAMVEILFLREKLETSVLNGMILLIHMLQIVNKDLSVLIQSNTSTMSHKSTRHVSNQKVNGLLKINLDTGITAARVMMIMMATGSAKIENNTECGTTLSDPTLMEFGETTMVLQMAHGLQILMMKPSDMS